MNAQTYSEAYVIDEKIWASEQFAENYAMLHAIGRLFLGGDPKHLDMIDDEIQEVFVQLWKKRAQLMQHPNVEAWLVEALRRQLLGA